MTEQTFGQRLRSARHAARLSQSRVSAASGIPKPRISQYENDRLRPSLETLGKLAAALGVAPGTLLPGPQQPLVVFMETLASLGVRPATPREARELAGLIAEQLPKPQHG